MRPNRIAPVSAALLGVLSLASLATAQSSFALSSSSMKDGGAMPAVFTIDGDRTTPPLDWVNAPEGTESFAVTMYAVDEKQSLLVLYNLPAGSHELPADFHGRGTLGVNSVDAEPHYSAPAAKETGDKKYQITVYALSAPVTFTGNDPVTMDALLTAMKDKTLGTAKMTVSYSRTADEISENTGGNDNDQDGRLPPQIGRALDDLQLSDDQSKKVQTALSHYKAAQKKAQAALLAEMKKTLTEEQYKDFEESLTSPPPPPDGGNGGGGGGGGGGGNGGPPPGR